MAAMTQTDAATGPVSCRGASFAAARPLPSPGGLAAAAQDLLKRRLDSLASEVARSVLFGRSDEDEAVRAYADSLGKLLLASDLRGYRDLLQELQGRREPGAFMPGDVARAEVRSLVASDLRGVLSRYSEGLPLPDKDRQATVDRYTFGRPFEMAKAGSDAITAAARGILVRSVRDGVPVPEAARLIRELKDTFTPAYAETVVRTGLASAHAAGRERAAEHPDVAPTVWGFEYMATRDRDVRPNHLAADGFRAKADDPAWDKLSPPLGHNCRCVKRLVTKQEANQRRLSYSKAIPQGAGPDRVGFGGRPQ